MKSLLWSVSSAAAATALTWVLWPYIRPLASPLFFVAIMVSSLYGGLAAGLLATVISTASTAYFFMTPQFSFNIGLDDAFRLSVFAIVALLTNSIGAQRQRAEEGQRRLIHDLQQANARVQTLSEQLPICPYCKRVRSSETAWMSLQEYLDDAPELRRSHAMCPDCSAREHPEFHAAR